MAIVTDPDNLDRYQVIFGTETSPKALSFSDVGSLAHGSATDTDGYTTAASLTFKDDDATFQTWSIAVGDVICIYNGVDAGHHVIATVVSETELTVENDADVGNFNGDTGLIYDIRDPGAGSLADGGTLQVFYSFGKEEWHTDSETYGSDDLRRHSFPWEPITRESMEVGGGVKHADWVHLNRKTRKLIRTGGWRGKNTGGTTIREDTGIITLGEIQAAAQAYFQQTDATTTPEDFEFTGAVNEAVFSWAGGDDRRDYLRLLLRYKGYTYAEADMADAGVTQLEPQVAKFPLGHGEDGAISADDSAILGTSPWRPVNQELESQADGVTDKDSPNQYKFTSALADFVTAKVAPGDRLEIKSGTQQGYYTIESVDDANTLTLKADFEWDGFTADETSLSYDVDTTNIIIGSTDGSVTDVDGDTGTLTSSTGGFSGNVTTGDMVIITEPADPLRGVYKVVSQDSDTVLTLNTSDQNFPAAPQANVDFTVVEPGMYLQSKEITITAPSPTSVDFDDANAGYGNRPTITLTGDTWDASVSAGHVITISSADLSANNGLRTVYARESSTIVSLVPTDILADDTGDTNAAIAIQENFLRDIKTTDGTITFGFYWRLFGVGESQENCYQFTQHELRQATDIDYGPTSNRGDIAAQMFEYAQPNGVTVDLFIDDVDQVEINNIKFTDRTGAEREEEYVSVLTITWDDNAQADADASYEVFFTNDDAGDNNGYDFNTPQAITIDDKDGVDMKGTVGAASQTQHTYAFDTNTQRGAASAGENVPYTVMCVGKNGAQYGIYQGTMTRSKTNTAPMSTPLERSYSNPT